MFRKIFKIEIVDQKARDEIERLKLKIFELERGQNITVSTRIDRLRYLNDRIPPPTIGVKKLVLLLLNHFDIELVRIEKQDERIEIHARSIDESEDNVEEC